MDERRSSEGGRRIEDQWSLWYRRITELVLFTVGTGGIVREIWFRDPDADPNLLILTVCLTLVGIPLAALADTLWRRRGD